MSAPTAERISLRAALGAAPEPDFELSLPEGWERIATDEHGEGDLERRVSRRLMQASRPDLFVEARRLLQDGFAQMREQGAVAVFVPTHGTGKQQLPVPASITAVLRSAPPGETLDREVQQAIRMHDAKPLLGDLRTLRFEVESQREIGDAAITVATTHYITPVPGTRRRRALDLVAVVGRPVGMPADHPGAAAMRAVLDACASTVRWVPREEAA